jgi:hypothetical protein
MVALKRIIPNCRAKFIDREVACLHKLNGEHNVAALYTILSYEVIVHTPRLMYWPSLSHSHLTSVCLLARVNSQLLALPRHDRTLMFWF